MQPKDHDLYNFSKRHERVLHPCFDVVPYREYGYSALLGLPNSAYAEELRVFKPFLKARLEYADLA